MNQVTFEQLEKKHPSLSRRESEDCWALNIEEEDLIPLLEDLRNEFHYDMLMDISGVDWGMHASPRFSVFYHTFSTSKHRHMRIVCHCKDNDFPSMPSITSLWAAADWHERETYDLMGIGFQNHPDLRRILMWEDYPYFPLRKEFPLAGIETDLPADDVAEITQAKVKAAPMMGGPFASKGGANVSTNEPFARDESWTENRSKPTEILNNPS